MQKVPYVFPIVGGRKVEHLYSNLEALDISLTPDHIAYLESILAFDIGFPYNHFVRSSPNCVATVRYLEPDTFPQGTDTSDHNYLFKTAGHFDKLPRQQAIRPAAI